MAQLEQRLRESELQVHGAFLGRGTSYGEMCMLRLQVSGSPHNNNAILENIVPVGASHKYHFATMQEAQRENAFLRAQFSERTDSAVLEKAEAEHRLGAVEAETRRLTDSLKENCERHSEEMKKQEERVRVCLTLISNVSVNNQTTE